MGSTLRSLSACRPVLSACGNDVGPLIFGRQTLCVRSDSTRPTRHHLLYFLKSQPIRPPSLLGCIPPSPEYRRSCCNGADRGLSIKIRARSGSSLGSQLGPSGAEFATLAIVDLELRSYWHHSPLLQHGVTAQSGRPRGADFRPQDLCSDLYDLRTGGQLRQPMVAPRVVGGGASGAIFGLAGALLGALYRKFRVSRDAIRPTLKSLPSLPGGV